MFYLEYRPQKFSDLLGLTVIANSLRKALGTSKFGHAYLFSGPRGTGKTTTARLVAKALSCANVVDGDPCNVCDACVAIKEGNYLDLMEIDAASNRGIDDIRALREKVKLAPSRGNFKIYIIDEVHMLTKEAFNALLKTLEEPPKHIVFVLCTTEPEKVPDTIVSRCQHFKFKRATQSVLVRKLEKICKTEGVEIPVSELKKIAKASLGGFRDAETLLEQVISGGVPVDELLTASSQENYIRFVEFLMSNDSTSALKFINTVFEEGTDLGVWLHGFLEYLRNLFLIKEGLGEVLVQESCESYENVVSQADGVSRGWLGKVIKHFSEALSQLRWAVIPQFPLELAVVAVTTLVETKSSESASPTELTSSVEHGDITKVENAWGSILKGVRPINHSIEAFLRSARPKAFDGTNLIIEVFYKFHKERLASPANKAALEQVVSQLLGASVCIQFILGDTPTPATISAVDTPDVAEVLSTPSVMLPSPLDVFDGEL